MIDKEKLREFLEKENKKFCEIMSKNHSHGQFCYEQGYADATAEVIIKLYSGEFDVKNVVRTQRDRVNKMSNDDLADMLVKQFKDCEGNIFYTFADNNERFCDWYAAFNACIKWLESEANNEL